MNRDWFAQSQPETRGRIKIGLEFLPQITVDLHEQGGDNAYYFSPPAEAINPHVTKISAGWDLLGRANAARFDERGWAYYIREVYDAFYPGYGDSWPTFQGSIGNTYEQASARGLAFARSDGDTLTYRDGVMHHFNAAIVTAITAASNREKLMRNYLEYRRSAVAEGEKGPIREYVIVPGQDASRADLLARNLATQGIEVRRARNRSSSRAHHSRRRLHRVERAADRAHDSQPARSENRAVGGVHQTAGRAPQDAAQRSDLRHHRVEPADAVRRGVADESLRDQRQDDDGAGAVRRAVPGAAAAGVEGRIPDAVGIGRGALSADAMRQGIRIRSVGGAFTHIGRRYPIGTAFIRNSENAADLNARLAALAVKHGAEMVPIDSTWVDEGTSLGSNEVAPLKTPKVLLVWDTPTQSLSAGWTRYTLERRFGVSVTAVRTSSLGRANFNDYDVIVMPSGNYAGRSTRPSQSHQGLVAKRRHAGHRGGGFSMGDGIPLSACWIRPS